MWRQGQVLHIWPDSETTFRVSMRQGFSRRRSMHIAPPLEAYQCSLSEPNARAEEDVDKVIDSFTMRDEELRAEASRCR